MIHEIKSSKNAKLDRNYTNHSIRAIVISTLDRECFEASKLLHFATTKMKEEFVKCLENKKKN